MHRGCALSLFLTLVLSALGQGEDDNWYFGSSNLLFGGGSPVSVSTPSDMNAQEGTASVSDANGQLLFYTDGNEAWNRDHERFPTWPSTTFPLYTLGGGASSAQAALIVPKPSSDRYFYIFTVAESGYGYGPARYSVVDMTLDGGFGDILPCAAARLWARGNIFTIGDTTFHEKLTAIRHANGRDVWVIAHRWESNEFWAVPVTPCGVDTANTVVSAVGTYVGGFFNFPTCNDRGMLVASPQGNRLAMCNEGPDGAASLDLYDFDPATGIVSNPILLPSPYAPFQGSTWCYGAAFSPNGQLLYVSSWYHPQLLQFDVTQPTANLIQASQVTVGISAFQTSPERGFGHLRVGPDGRLYAVIWNTDLMAIIPDPDIPGTGCGFLDGAIQCQPSAVPVIPGLQTPVQKGLPAPVLPSKALLIPLADTLIACVGSPLPFTIPPGLDSACLGFVEWIFGDPASGPLNTSSVADTAHTYTAPGIYLAGMVVDQGCEQDTLKVPVRVQQDTLSIQSPAPIELCAGDTAVLTIPGLPTEAIVTWSTGAVSDSILVGDPGTYSFTVTAACATAAGVAEVLAASIPPITDLPDTSICAGGTALYSVPAEVNTQPYAWSDGSAVPFFTATDTGTYYLEVNGACGAVRDTFRVFLTDEPFARIPELFTLCLNSTVELVTDSLVGTFIWDAVASGSILEVDRPGWYSYTVNTPCGSLIDSVRVVQEVCDSVLACSSFFVPNAFTPDGDGINDGFAPVWSAKCRTSVELLIFNRWGELIHTWRTGDPAWDGSFDNTACPIGIYPYLINARTADGEQTTRRGHVALIR